MGWEVCIGLFVRKLVVAGALKVDHRWGGGDGPLHLLPEALVSGVPRQRGGVVRASPILTLQMIQLGALVAILVPLLCFAVSCRRQTGSFDGITAELAVAVVYFAFDIAEYVITDPVKAVLFLVLSWVAYKLATGRLR